MIAMVAVVVVTMVALLVMRGDTHHFLPSKSAAPAVQRLPTH